MEGVVFGDFTLAERLGKGAFGVVHKATRGAGGDAFAAKLIEKKGDEAKIEKLRSALALEVKALQAVEGDVGILQLVAEEESEKYWCLVCDLMCGGELMARVGATKRWSEQNARAIFSQLAEAFAFLQGRNVLHRDLKPPNVMFASADSDLVKVVDFGTALVVDPADPVQLHGIAGSLRYMAPEVATKRPYSFKADAWSLGCVLHILLTGGEAFPQKNIMGLKGAVTEVAADWDAAGWRGVSAAGRGLCESLLRADAAARSDATAAAAHAWASSAASPRAAAQRDAELRGFGSKAKETHRQQQLRAAARAALKGAAGDAGDDDMICASPRGNEILTIFDAKDAAEGGRRDPTSGISVGLTESTRDLQPSKSLLGKSFMSQSFVGKAANTSEGRGGRALLAAFRAADKRRTNTADAAGVDAAFDACGQPLSAGVAEEIVSKCGTDGKIVYTELVVTMVAAVDDPKLLDKSCAIL